MTAADVKTKISEAIEYAQQHEPTNTDARARCFVAALSGGLMGDDKPLADKLFSSIFETPVGSAL